VSDATDVPGRDRATNGAVDCTEALSKLFAFLDSELDEADADRIRVHLADCEPCLSEYDIEDHLKKLVRRSCVEAAPAWLHVRIRQQITVLGVQAVAPARGAGQPRGFDGA
jgi:anti-sigma factor (TIGR02949 family)